jgi:hypothetical protein
MPSSAAILEGLTTVANDWRWLAIAWHLLLGMFLLRLATGWRPSERLAGTLLTLPLVSVAALAWVSGNPFNGALFSAVSVALFGFASLLPANAVRIGSSRSVIAGALLVAFGWLYPHFLQTDSWVPYLYAAPLGLLPCPTLAAIIGMSLLFDSLRSRPWSVLISATAVVYGLIGAFGLGVEIDLVLIAGAVWMRIRQPRSRRSIAEDFAYR